MKMVEKSVILEMYISSLIILICIFSGPRFIKGQKEITHIPICAIQQLIGPFVLSTTKYESDCTKIYSPLKYISFHFL